MSEKKYSNRFSGIPSEFINEYKQATTGSKEKENTFLNGGIQEWLSDELIKARETFNINFEVGIELSESGWVKIKEIYISQVTELFKDFPKMIQEYLDDVDTHFKEHTQVINDKIYYVDQLWEIMNRYSELFYVSTNYLNSTNIILIRG